MRQWFLGYLYLFLAFLVLFLVIKYVLAYVMPFILAVILAALIDPAVRFLEDRARMPRTLAVMLILTVIVTIFLTLLFLGGARIVLELSHIAAALPVIFVEAQEFLQRVIATLEGLVRDLPPEIGEIVDEQVRGLYHSAGELVHQALDGLQALVFDRLPNLLVILLVTLLATFFLSRDKETIGVFLLGLFPPAWRQRVRTVNDDVAAGVIGLINAQLLLVSITTIITILGLNVLGIRYSWVVGLGIGLLDIIPVIGPGLVFIPWIIFHLVADSWTLGLGLAGLYLLTSAARYATEPVLIGERTGIHPLAVLFALYLGVRIFGVAGVIIGPVAAIIIKAIGRSGVLPFLLDGGGDGSMEA